MIHERSAHVNIYVGYASMTSLKAFVKALAFHVEANAVRLELQYIRRRHAGAIYLREVLALCTPGQPC